MELQGALVSQSIQLLARYEQGGYWLDDNGQRTQGGGPTE